MEMGPLVSFGLGGIRLFLGGGPRLLLVLVVIGVAVAWSYLNRRR